MLTNTKIFVRLAALVIALLTLTGALAAVGIMGLADMKRGLETVYLDRVIPLVGMTSITSDYFRVRVLVIDSVNSTDTAAIATNKTKIDELAAKARGVWTEYLKTHLAPEEKVLAEATTASFDTYDGIRNRVLASLVSGDFDGGKALAKSEGGPALAAVMEKLEKLTALQVNVAGEEYKKAEEAYSFDRMLLIGGLILAIVLGAGIAWLIARSITMPLRGIIDVMQALTSGNLTVEVKGSERKDEVGEVAKAVLVFKDGLVEAEQLRGAQEEAKTRAETDRRAMMQDLANRFESSVGGVVSAVTSAATELQSTAQSLSATAEETSRQSNAVAAASEQMTQNVQTVAAATEELTVSIREIGSQVAESTRIVGGAVTQAEDTNAKVKSLSEAALKIGAVVTLINEIASQTNLLALNATIEAARAGEAGKGFAVVASEVKNLATQTAKATEEIAGQVKAIQDSTDSAAQAIQAITVTINRVNEISTAIASAVEEQGAATQEISRNVQEASTGTAEVTSNITGVTQASQQTSAGSAEVLSASSELAKNGERLKKEVDTFLHTIRAG